MTDRHASDPMAGAPRPAHGAVLAGAERIDARAFREFIHELSNLVDSSIRSVELARRDLRTPGDRELHLSGAHHRLDTVMTGLWYVAELIHVVSTQVSGVRRLGRPSLPDASSPVRQSIEHAVDLLEPLASDRRIRIETEIDSSIDDLGNRALFPVVVNALRNAIDSIGCDGMVMVRAIRDERDGESHALRIEIIDDGAGLPPGRDPTTLFEFGVTSKPGSSGIGLALAREIIGDLDGTIELLHRADRSSGAMLRAIVPWCVLIPQKEAMP